VLEVGETTGQALVEAAALEASASGVEDPRESDEDLAHSVAPKATELEVGAPQPLTPAELPSPAVSRRPLSAATDSLFLGSGLGELPTRFDLQALERHDSPWTPEKQAQALLENATELCDLFVGELAKKGDKQRTARLHYEAARLFENPIGDLEAAAKHFEQAHRLAPTHVPSLRGARRTQLGLKRYQQAARLFDAEADVVSETEQKAWLLYHKAQLLEAQLGQRVEAREALEKASELAPRNLTIVKATALAQEQAGAWEPLVKSFERCVAALEENPKERAVYLSQMARVSAVRLRDVPRAIELYKGAFEADPLAPGALPALKELLYRQGRFTELVEVLEREAQLAKSPEAHAFAKFRVARLWVERLSDVARGLQALEHASALVPADRTVLAELVRLYELLDRSEELASASERLLALSPPTSPEPLHRLGELYETKLDQQERAIERYSQALALRADYHPSILALDRLRTNRGEWTELIQMLRAEADSSGDVEQRAALYVRIAGVFEDQLCNVDGALAHLKLALEIRPGQDAAYKSIVRLLSAAQDWRALIEIYERGVESATATEEKVTTLFQRGRIEEDALGMPAAAVTTYRRILDLDGNRLEAIHALQRAAERGKKYEDLILGLELEASATTERHRQLNLRHRIATVLEGKLGDSAAAIEKLQALLDTDPAYLPAISSLARIYFAAQRFEELVATYKRELAVTTGVSARADLLCRMAEICEKRLSQQEEAASHYRRAVQAEPRHPLAVKSLRRLCTLRGEFKEVARLLESEVELAATTEEKVRTWFLLGEVHENRLESQEKALEAYGNALELAPDFRPAADGCLRLLEQSHNFKALKERLAKEALSATEPLYRISADYIAGELSRDHLKQLHEAATAFEAVQREAPEYSGAWLALERLYSQLGKKDSLLALYASAPRVLESVGAGVAAHKSRLHLLETHTPVDTEALKSAHMAVLRILPRDIDALLGLEQIALSERDPALLGQVDAKLGVASLDRHSLSAHQTRLAEAMDARGDDGALQVYRSALAHDPENFAAVRGISRVAQRTQSPTLLAEAAENEGSLLKQPTEAARLLTIAAEALRRSGDVATAIQYLSRALEIDPDHATSSVALVELQTEAGSVNRLIDDLSRAAGSSGASERRAQLWIQVARLQSEKQGDAGAAIAAAGRAAREQPANIEAHMLLANLYGAGKKWIESTGEYQEVLKLHPPEDVRFRALLSVARIQHEHLSRIPLAASNVAAALEIQPESHEALRLCLTLQLARDELKAATDTAQRLVKAAGDPKEKAEALLQLARLERQRKDEEAACAAYAAAVSIAGTEGTACLEYRVLLEQATLKPRSGAATFVQYAAALTEFLNQHGLDKTAMLAAHLELGRTLYNQLEDPEAGLRELQVALVLAPQDTSLRAEVAERIAASGQHSEAVRYYRELLRQTPQAAHHWRALAQGYEALGRAEQARLCLAPLVAAHDATDAEKARYGGVTVQPAALKPLALDAAVLRLFEEGAAVTGPAIDLVMAVAPALAKVFPTPFENYGVGRGDKVTGRMNHALRQTADRVARLFGVEEFELYIHSGAGAGISVEMSEQPALFVGREVSALSEAEQVFQFARVMTNIARGIAVVDKLPGPDLQVLLACAARTSEPGFGAELGDAVTLDALAKRLSKAMPWFSGGRLEIAARGFASARLDTALWARHAKLVAARVAAVVADDLAVCLSALTREGNDDAFIEQVAAFVSSDAGLALKRKLAL
jgi:tetratricopeptide (TPR) repeat protein